MVLQEAFFTEVVGDALIALLLGHGEIDEIRLMLRPMRWPRSLSHHGDVLLG